MLFLVVTDEGIDTVPLTATSLSDAANQIKQLYGQGTGQVNVALLLPDLTGTLVQNPDPSQSTITQTGDAANQQAINQKAETALTNNSAYLGIASPTNAQVVAQVKALTQQVDGLIRLAVGDFSATT